MIELRAIADEELMEIEEVEGLLQEQTFTEEDADRLIRIYKAIERDKLRFKELAEKQKAEIEHRYQMKAEKYDKELESITLQLKAFAEGQKMKETKTQKKYQLLSGDIIIKKPVKQLTADKEILLQSITGTEYNNYKRVKEEVAWSDLKKRLDYTDDGLIIDKETGEIVNLEGLSVEEKPGSVEIK